MSYKKAAVFGLSCLLVACGGGSGRDKPVPKVPDTVSSSSSSTSSSTSSSSSSSSSSSGASTAVREGVFLDSAVGGIAYTTDTLTGHTTSSGRFDYIHGEKITFSIGDLVFPATNAKPTVTSLDIANTSDVTDQSLINMVRLLLSLDTNRDGSDGVTIGESAIAAATQVDFGLGDAEFAAAVANLLSNSGADDASLIDRDVAISHIENTLANQVNQRTVLSADGPGDTYALINNTLGGTAVESPVCDEDTDVFGPRITEVMDTTLDAPVFAFHILKDVDGDRCQADITDRQRIEIKTYGASPNELVASEGEIHTYRWKFKLDQDFQPSPSFTHIFQIKASGGNDDNMPIITITPRHATPEKLEILHAANGADGAKAVATAELAQFTGEWIDVFVRTRNADEGSFEITLTRISDGAELISWSHNNLDMWREGANINRPKWGIYRSLNNAEYLRDETVLFNDFCIAEHTNTCPSAIVGSPPDEGDSSAADFDFESDTLDLAPAEFDVTGEVLVSNEKAQNGDQSVKMSHPVDADVRMRKEFGATATGRAQASLFIPQNVGVDSLLTVYAGDFKGASRVIDIIFKPDGTIRRREGSSQTDVATYIHDKWTNVTISWNEVATTNEFTLSVDGTIVGTFAATNPGLTPDRMEVKFGQNSAAISTESLYVDSVSAGITDDESEGTPAVPTDEADFDFESDATGTAPADFTVEGDIVVSNTLFKAGSQSVKFSHLVEGNVRMRKALTAAPTGSVKASIHIPTDVGQDSVMTVYAAENNSANRVIDILFKPDGRINRRQGSEQILAAEYLADTWTDVEISWSDIDTTGEFTLTINGEAVGSFPVTTSGLVPERVEFKFGGNSSATTEQSIYIDNVSLF